MLAAKHAPGRFNAPYVTGMNVSSARTGILQNNFTISEALSLGVTNPIGTSDYVIILYAPALSFLFGPGGAGLLPTNSKLGGLSISQISNVNTNVLSYANFYDATAYSMSAIYGS